MGQKPLVLLTSFLLNPTRSPELARELRDDVVAGFSAVAPALLSPSSSHGPLKWGRLTLLFIPSGINVSTSRLPPTGIRPLGSAQKAKETSTLFLSRNPTSHSPDVNNSRNNLLSVFV